MGKVIQKSKKNNDIQVIEQYIGIGIEDVDKIIYLVQEDENCKDEGITDKCIIMAFMYWFQYLPISQICNTLKISPRTFHTHYNKMIDILYKCFSKIMNDRYKQMLEESGYLEHPLTKILYRPIASDVTTVQVCTPIDDSKQSVLYNGKSKSHVLKFQAEVHTKSKRFFRISSGYPGAMSDSNVAKEMYVKRNANGNPLYYNNGEPIFEHDEYPILGDKAYEGLSNFVVPHKRRGNPFTLEERIHNNFISSNRVFLENFFLKIKSYKVLSTRYRGDKEQLDKIVLILSFVMDLKENIGDGFDYKFDIDKLEEIKEKRMCKFV